MQLSIRCPGGAKERTGSSFVSADVSSAGGSCSVTLDEVIATSATVSYEIAISYQQST
jgi:hypothetical protein